MRVQKEGVLAGRNGGQRALAELTPTGNRTPSPLFGGEGAPKTTKRLDQAAPPWAPPIRCKKERINGYGCSNNEIGHLSLLHGRTNAPLSDQIADVPRLLSSGSGTRGRSASTYVGRAEPAIDVRARCRGAGIYLRNSCRFP